MGKRKPQRFVPFAQGNRDCVGQTLARLNLSTTLAQLYGSFSFQLAEEVSCIPSACSWPANKLTIAIHTGICNDISDHALALASCLVQCYTVCKAPNPC